MKLKKRQSKVTLLRTGDRSLVVQNDKRQETMKRKRKRGTVDLWTRLGIKRQKEEIK